MSKDLNKIDLSRYSDEMGLTKKRLNFGLWFVRNRQKLFGILVAFLAIIAFITWGNTIYNFAYYLIYGVEEDDRQVADFLKTEITDHDYLVSIGAQDIRYSNVKVFSGDGKYDFLVKIENLNNDYWAHFGYTFEVNGREIETIENFILPGEIKYLTTLSQRLDKYPSGTKFKIKTISWNRVDKHKYPHWESYRNSRINFSTYDKEFIPVRSSGLSEKIQVSTLKFNIKNNTSYGYWEIPLTILLYSRGNMVGVYKYELQNFESLEDREISFNIAESLRDITKIEVWSELDITRSDIYKKLY